MFFFCLFVVCFWRFCECFYWNKIFWYFGNKNYFSLSDGFFFTWSSPPLPSPLPSLSLSLSLSQTLLIHMFLLFFQNYLQIQWLARGAHGETENLLCDIQLHTMTMHIGSITKRITVRRSDRPGKTRDKQKTKKIA